MKMKKWWKNNVWDFFQKPRGTQKKINFGDIRKGYFVWRRDIFFERVRLTMAKRKNDETKRRRKTNGVSERDEKKNEKKND